MPIVGLACITAPRIGRGCARRATLGSSRAWSGRQAPPGGGHHTADDVGVHRSALGVDGDGTVPRWFVRALWGNQSGRLYVGVHRGVSIPNEGR